LRAGDAPWPPRLPEQPIFLPVMNEDHAIRTAVRGRNLPASARSSTGVAELPLDAPVETEIVVEVRDRHQSTRRYGRQ
jgi:hypothetical protein